VAIWVDEAPDERGRFGAALIFVRWNATGDTPVGHVESPPLAWARTAAEAEERIRTLSLYDVKTALDAAIAQQPGEW